MILALLLSNFAFASAAPELLCEPNAKIEFSQPRFGARTVTLSGGRTLEFPWHQNPRSVTALELKDTGDDEALASVADETSFLAFRSPARTLYIEPTLLHGQEADGLAVLGEFGQYEIFHCRSR